MSRLKQNIAALCLLTLATTAIAPSAFGSPRASIGAVSGQKKLTEGMGNGQDDLAFSPILLEMAKLIGRTGLPAGFFLQNDGPLPEEPGVDLRTLLLYQAGLIKMPVRLITGRKSGPTQVETPPTLSLQVLPAEPRGPMDTQSGSSLPSLASTPLPRAPEQVKVITPKAHSVGQPEKIRIAASGGDSRPAPAPLISVDISKLQADLKVYGEEAAQPPELHADIPQLAMAMPRTNVMPFITKNAFKLWTFRAEGKPYAGDASATEYNGTFVVSTVGAIKSITGRHFVLQPGKLLASNQGGELLFKTALAEISVEPNATAVMEVTTSGGGIVVKVFSLETIDGSSVIVKLPGEKAETVRLAAGETVVIADHPLAATELQGTLAAKKLNPTTARGSFSVKDFVDKDLIVIPQARANDAEHYAALSALKKRVGEGH